MSNKLAFLKKAVLYAYQNPAPLVDILNTEIADVVTEIKITGSATVNITESAGGTSAYTAKAYSQYGDEMDDAVVLSIKTPVAGVSIADGVVTVTGAVAEDTTFIVQGTVAGTSVVEELTVTVVVREVESIVVSGDATLINDVLAGFVSDPYTAIAYDIDGEVLSATFAFALKTPVAGVSIHQTTGVVTLTNAVADATEFTIEVSALNSAVVGEFDVVVSIRAVDNIVITGDATLINDVLAGFVSDEYTAIAYAEDEEPTSASITLTIKTPVEGVSIADGIVTLTNAVAHGTTFIILATDSISSVTEELTVTVAVRTATSIVITGDATLVNDAINGLVSDEYTAVAYAADNEPTSATIVLTIKVPVEGVSIADGVVTLTNAVTNGTTFIILATDSITSVTAEKTVTVSVVP